MQTRATAGIAGISFRAGLVAGFMPLVRLLVIVALAVLATIGTRLVTPGIGFATQGLILLIVLGVGGLAAWVVYAISCVRALRRVGEWQREGDRARAAGALWALAIGALLALLPVIIAALVPQHPAPVLPHLS